MVGFDDFQDSVLVKNSHLGGGNSKNLGIFKPGGNDPI